MVYLVTLTDPEDAEYLCEYTVEAANELEAKVFAEVHNPGKVCTGAVAQG